MAKRTSKKAKRRTTGTPAAPTARKAVKSAAKGKARRKRRPAPSPKAKTASAKAKGASRRVGAPAAAGPAAAPAEAAAPKRPPRPVVYETAETMAQAQRSISVSEFFAKNRHLLGFDNPRKALLTTVKEAVDNALDACEEGGILPEVGIWIEQLSDTHFKVMVEDNGPGIVRGQIPSIFGRLLYGSKFHRLRMSRGQQGIGISAAGMYGLLTTGRPVRITSRTGPRSKAHYYELQIDTRKNRPAIIRDETIEWERAHGTRVEIELEARYQRGRQSVDDYLEQTAIGNPHVTLVYNTPDGRVDRYQAAVEALPPLPKAVRPHPYGIELGVLLKMLNDSKARTVQQFLTKEFSRVSPRVAREVLEKAHVSPRARPSRLKGDTAKAIYEAIQQTRILAPATDCVVPIGEEQLLSGLRQVVPASFYAASTRRPAVYRGNPFIIEAAIAHGRPDVPKDADGGAEQAEPKTPARKAAASSDGDGEGQLATVIRFANRVPLQYQQSGCAIYKSVVGMNWKSYGLSQARGALPTGPLTVVVHMASVWVPFTSESKEAIASYPEILKEIRLALQECGRRLATHIRKTVRVRQELKKRSYIEKYIPAIGEALGEILELKDRQIHRVCVNLKEVLDRSRKF